MGWVLKVQDPGRVVEEENVLIKIFRATNFMDGVAWEEDAVVSDAAMVEEVMVAVVSGQIADKGSDRDLDQDLDRPLSLIHN